MADQKISARTSASTLDGTETIGLIQGGADRKALLSAAKTYITGGIKVYRAYLTQAGTSDPTAVVLENTLGGTVVWTRGSTGNYAGTLTGVFTSNKTFISPRGQVRAYFNGSDNDVGVIECYYDSVNAVAVAQSTIDAGVVTAVDVFANIPIEIIVYP